jgi:hypothetical protein
MEAMPRYQRSFAKRGWWRTETFLRFLFADFENDGGKIDGVRDKITLSFTLQRGFRIALRTAAPGLRPSVNHKRAWSMAGYRVSAGRSPIESMAYRRSPGLADLLPTVLHRPQHHPPWATRTKRRIHNGHLHFHPG